MNEETKPTPATAQPMNTQTAAPRGDQMIPKYRFDELIGTREALKIERDNATSELADLKAKFESMTAEVTGIKSGHNQELHLVQSGFTDPSVRRFFRREYAEAMKEYQGKDKPAFDAWLDSSKDHALFSPHFSKIGKAPATEAEAETNAAPQDDSARLMAAMRAALSGNPDNGASQPTNGRPRDWNAEELRKVRAKGGGSLGGHTAEVIAQWKAKGLIK
jgi:hypothetical protein